LGITSTTRRRAKCTQNGVFLEKEFLNRKYIGSKVQLEEIQDFPPLGKSTTLEVESDIPPKPTNALEPRRSARMHENVLIMDDDESDTYHNAMGITDFESWLGSMRSKLKSLRSKLAKIEISLSIKLGLTRRGSDKFKQLLQQELLAGSDAYIC
jgi:hypothetical protein